MITNFKCTWPSVPIQKWCIHWWLVKCKDPERKSLSTWPWPMLCFLHICRIQWTTPPSTSTWIHWWRPCYRGSPLNFVQRSSFVTMKVSFLRGGQGGSRGVVGLLDCWRFFSFNFAFKPRAGNWQCLCKLQHNTEFGAPWLIRRYAQCQLISKRITSLPQLTPCFHHAKWVTDTD